MGRPSGVPAQPLNSAVSPREGPLPLPTSSRLMDGKQSEYKEQPKNAAPGESPIPKQIDSVRASPPRGLPAVRGGSPLDVPASLTVDGTSSPLAAHRRGSVTSQTSSQRVRRKPVPSLYGDPVSPRSNSSRQEMLSDGGSLGRRSSALSDDSVATAEANRSGGGETAPLGLGLSGTDARDDPESTAARVISEGTTAPSQRRQATASTSRPSTVPPARPDPVTQNSGTSSNANDTIMIDGQAFVFDDDDSAGVTSPKAVQQSSPAPVPAAAAAAAASGPTTRGHGEDPSPRTGAAQQPAAVEPTKDSSAPPRRPVYQWHLKEAGTTAEAVAAAAAERDREPASTMRRSKTKAGRPASSAVPRRKVRTVSGNRGGRNDGSRTKPRKASRNASGEKDKSKTDKPEGPPPGAYAIHPPTRAEMDEAADLLIYNENKDMVRFGDLFRERRTLVCFLRHWFCPMCQEFSMSMKQIDPLPLERADLGLVIVGQGHPHVISAYKRVMGVPEWIQMFADPSRRIYRALGMTMRTNDPGPVCAKPDYITMSMMKGSMAAIKKGVVDMPIRNPGDLKLLGGEFIFGPGVQCSFVHRMMTTRGHLDVPRILAQAGCDMTLKSQPRAGASIDDISVKSVGRAKKTKSNKKGIKAGKNGREQQQLARSFGQDRMQKAAAKDGTGHVATPTREFSPIPAVPRIPASFDLSSKPGQLFVEPEGDDDEEDEGPEGARTPRATVAPRKLSHEQKMVEEKLRELELERDAQRSIPPSISKEVPRRAVATAMSSPARQASAESSRTAQLLARGPQNAERPLMSSNGSWLAENSRQSIKRTASTPDFGDDGSPQSKNGFKLSNLGSNLVKSNSLTRGKTPNAASEGVAGAGGGGGAGGRRPNSAPKFVPDASGNLDADRSLRVSSLPPHMQEKRPVSAMAAAPMSSSRDKSLPATPETSFDLGSSPLRRQVVNAPSTPPRGRNGSRSLISESSPSRRSRSSEVRNATTSSSFLADLDVLDEFVHKLPAHESRGANGKFSSPSQRYSHYSGETDDAYYRTSLESWRTDPEEDQEDDDVDAADTDDDGVEDRARWTRSSAASTPTGKRSRASHAETFAAGRSSDSAGGDDRRNNGSLASRTSSESQDSTFDSRPPVADGRSPMVPVEVEDSLDDSEESDAEQQPKHNGTTGLAPATPVAALGESVHSGRKFGQDDSIVEEEDEEELSSSSDSASSGKAGSGVAAVIGL